MDKLLNAIASRLTIRRVVEEEVEQTWKGVVTFTMQMFDHRDVEDEVKELFKKELNNHLFTKLQNLKVGEYLDYGFDYGDVRPLGTLMEEANDNLAEVLLKLPALNDGETYDFPCNTYFGFTLTEKNEEKATGKLNCASTWIMEEYSKQ